MDYTTLEATKNTMYSNVLKDLIFWMNEISEDKAISLVRKETCISKSLFEKAVKEARSI